MTSQTHVTAGNPAGLLVDFDVLPPYPYSWDMAKTTYRIYGLIDPRSHEIYYIGKTRHVLHDRMDEHFLESCEALVSKKNQAIIRSGDLPWIINLDTGDDEATAFDKEP